MPPTTRKKTAKKVSPKAPATPAQQGYARVKVTDVWVSDDDIGKAPLQKYDWIGIGDKAIEGAKVRPDDWLLVSDNAPSSLASRITAQRIATLTGPRFLGWQFRGKVDQMREDPITRKLNRGRVWIKASRTTVDV